MYACRERETLVEDTATAFVEADEALVVVKTSLPDKRAIPKYPYRHFLAFLIKIISQLVTSSTAGGEVDYRELGKNADVTLFMSFGEVKLMRMESGSEQEQRGALL